MPPFRTVYLVDGSGQFHRAYHAIRGLATSRGLPTNATYGFTTMLRKLLDDEKPEYAVILFDAPGRTFRHEEYAEYKANRPKMDDDLAVQVPYIRRVCEALRIPIEYLAGLLSAGDPGPVDSALRKLAATGTTTAEVTKGGWHLLVGD